MCVCAWKTTKMAFLGRFTRSKGREGCPGGLLFLQKIRSLWNVFLIDIFRGAPEGLRARGGAASVR